MNNNFARLLGYELAVGHLDAYNGGLFRPDPALADWQRQHADLTARLVTIESEIDDRVCRLLADHSRHAMIDYPYGAV